ncbi:MAG: VOC family protein [Hyphomicrobiaceae bacterium]|nr:VOC family protein [Hyphomicrobiaceae bacterium]
MTEIDHIAVVAPDLGTGVAWVRETLGVEMPAGGRHREMGTHNRLVGLGPEVYLEVIAVDPEAPRPPHRRWFGLDDRDAVRQHWREGRRLRGYVARCTGIAATIGGEGETFGEPMRVSRGERQWLFAVRPDGELPLGGALPCLIDWREQGTLAPSMPDLGLRLQSLRVETPNPGAVHAALDAIGLARKPDISRGPQVRLTATITTPDGARVLT